MYALRKSMVFPTSVSAPHFLCLMARAARTMSMPIGWIASSDEFVAFTSDSEKSSMGLVLKVLSPLAKVVDC